MGLLKRMRRLVSANLNDLIEQCENPERMLRQAVRDMETALGQILDGAARAIAHHKILVRQLSDQRAAVDRSARQAETAVARGDDNAARAELLRKAKHQRMVETLVGQVANAEALSQRLKNQVSAMRIKLAEARRKLVDVTARNRAVVAQRKFVAQLPGDTELGRVCSDFDAMCARVEQSEAETEALLELLGEPTAPAASDLTIEAELRSLEEAAHHATC